MSKFSTSPTRTLISVLHLWLLSCVVVLISVCVVHYSFRYRSVVMVDPSMVTVVAKVVSVVAIVVVVAIKVSVVCLPHKCPSYKQTDVSFL